MPQTTAIKPSITVGKARILVAFLEDKKNPTDQDKEQLQKLRDAINRIPEFGTERIGLEEMGIPISEMNVLCNDLQCTFGPSARPTIFGMS